MAEGPDSSGCRSQQITHTPSPCSDSTDCACQTLLFCGGVGEGNLIKGRKLNLKMTWCLVFAVLNADLILIACCGYAVYKRVCCSLFLQVITWFKSTLSSRSLPRESAALCFRHSDIHWLFTSVSLHKIIRMWAINLAFLLILFYFFPFVGVRICQWEASWPLILARWGIRLEGWEEEGKKWQTAVPELTTGL